MAGGTLSAASGWVHDALARLGGSDGITMSPHAGTQLCVIAGKLIALVATFAFLAVTASIVQLANLPGAFAVPIGLIIGLLISLLLTVWDQGLVASAVRPGMRPPPLGTLFRVGVAGLIGAVLWASAMLFFFQTDIDIEMDSLRLEQLADNERFLEIPILEDERDRLRAEINNPMTRSVADDNEIIRLTNILTNTDGTGREQLYRAAEQAVVVELEGNSASGRPGPGPATAEKERIRDRRRAERDQAQAQLDAASAEVAADIRTESMASVAAANDDLQGVIEDLTRRQAEQRAAEDAAVTANNSPDAKGLAGLEVVGRLAEDRPTSVLIGVLLYLALILLFLPPVLAIRVLAPDSQKYLQR